jgi:hypothetical protein
MDVYAYGQESYPRMQVPKISTIVLKDINSRLARRLQRARPPAPEA